MLLKTINGIELGGFTTSHPQEENKLNIYQNEQYMVKFNFRCSLNPGTYFMNAGVLGMIENEQTYLHRISDSLIFEVLPVEGNKSTAIVDFDFRSEIKRNICQGEKNED